MRRTLVAAALLIAVAAAPVAGLPQAHAQAPSATGLDTVTPLPIDVPAIEGSANLLAGVSSLPPVKASAPSGMLPISIPTPSMDVPALQLPSPPAPDTPASQPSLTAAPATQVDAREPTENRREVGEITPVATPVVPPATTSAEAVEEIPTTSVERSAAQDLGAWIPGVTVPLDEPVPERPVALPAPVVAAPTFSAPQPAQAAPAVSPESVAETDAVTVVEAPPSAAREPVRAAVNVPREVSPVSFAPSPRAIAVVPPATITPVMASSAPAVPVAVGGEEPANVAVAAPADSQTVHAAQPAPDLPRINSPAPEPSLAIPTLARLEMTGGLDLSWFAVVFGVLGSAALGLHLLLKRIEARL
ncbi:MAG: hypothetical protein AB7R89_23495 [Dehalococcoidia bacterium]